MATPTLSFREFLLTEGSSELTEKVGDVLSAVHALIEDAQGLGPRDLALRSERVVNVIRRVLHSHWSRESRPILASLQKCGVAIMKAIEEKGELPDVLASVAAELEKQTGKSGDSVNKLAAPPTAPDREETSTAEPDAMDFTT